MEAPARHAPARSIAADATADRAPGGWPPRPPLLLIPSLDCQEKMAKSDILALACRARVCGFRQLIVTDGEPLCRSELAELLASKHFSWFSCHRANRHHLLRFVGKSAFSAASGRYQRRGCFQADTKCSQKASRTALGFGSATLTIGAKHLSDLWR